MGTHSKKNAHKWLETRNNCLQNAKSAICQRSAWWCAKYYINMCILDHFEDLKQVHIQYTTNIKSGHTGECP